MIEYLIRPVDVEWFDLPAAQWPQVMRPSSIPSCPVAGWGNHRIAVDGAEIAFSDEDPGIQVSIDGPMPEPLARRIAEEVLSNIERVTGQRGRLVAL